MHSLPLDAATEAPPADIEAMVAVLVAVEAVVEASRVGTGDPTMDLGQLPASLMM